MYLALTSMHRNCLLRIEGGGARSGALANFMCCSHPSYRHRVLYVTVDMYSGRFKIGLSHGAGYWVLPEVELSVGMWPPRD